MRTYTVDKQGNKQPVDWYDFMTNDKNPTLVRLAQELEADPEFQEVVKKFRLDKDGVEQ